MRRVESDRNVEAVRERCDHARYTVRVGPLTLRATTPKTVDIEPGTEVPFVIRHATALPAATEPGTGTAAPPGPPSLQDATRAVY